MIRPSIDRGERDEQERKGGAAHLIPAAGTADERANRQFGAERILLPQGDMALGLDEAEQPVADHEHRGHLGDAGEENALGHFAGSCGCAFHAR